MGWWELARMFEYDGGPPSKLELTVSGGFVDQLDVASNGPLHGSLSKVRCTVTCACMQGMFWSVVGM